MKASFIQRLGAYIVDIVIVSIITSIILMIIPTDSKVEEIVVEQNDLLLSVTEDIENLDLETYTNELIKLEYQYDRYTIPASVVNLVMVVLYFVVFQYYNKGRTLGKKLFKIKVIGKNKDLSINMLWIRALVNSSLAALFLLIVLTLVFLNINDYMTYYMIKMGISLVDTIIVITSAFMILYRKDKRGIQDLLASTEVVKEG